MNTLSCAFCGQDEELGVHALPNSNQLVSLCSGCATALETSKQHIEDHQAWSQHHYEERINVSKQACFAGSLVAGAGVGWAMAPGWGLVVIGGAFFAFGVLSRFMNE